MALKSKIIISVFLSLTYLSVIAQQKEVFYKVSENPLYKNSSIPTEQRIEDLLQRMTLEEKVLQMTQWTYGTNANENNIEDKMNEVRPEIGSLLYRSDSPKFRNQIQKKAMEDSRLGIPIIFAFDVIHGYRTIFPIPLAQACTWDTELVKRSCAVAAKESHSAGIDWTFSPMLDVARDLRWGRVAEAYGEDPYANSVFGVAAVQGYQGNSLADKYTIAACLKHYIGYSLSEGGRDYQYTDVSGQTLWETFMPPFEAGIKAGAATVMSGFNDITGTPATANYYTLTDVLKNQWKHDGFVVSDWESIENLIPQGVAKDRKEAAYKCVMAGLEMDMKSDVYLENLPLLVSEGKVPIETIDEAVRRILRLKFKLGLFDNPYVEELPDNERYLQPEFLELAENVAAETMVLLKNENSILPLNRMVKNIAVIGPMANDSLHIMGSWEGIGKSDDAETLLEGIQKEFGNKANINYAKGCDFDGLDSLGFAKARIAAEKSEIIILCIGEKRQWSGESGSRSNISLPAIQEELVAELSNLNKPIVLVISSGRPNELSRIHSKVDAIIEIWQPGLRGGSALAGILSGRTNPSAKLAITFPLTSGQQPMYYNRRQSSRPIYGQYRDVSKDPLYDFGHGLSFTEYKYGEIQLSDTIIDKSQTLIAEIEIENTGKFDGKETMLWFISDPVANISRPIKELKYFEKKSIKAGEKMVYSFEIVPERDLSYPDNTGKRHLEAGDFYLQVGNKKVKFELVD
ncbi:MAG: glycoside hydrolase family 3 C-terminal domain-containing protein [Salinivirgaceae bacterium]|jgi:beta-glucosidase|nr:glycoside hydrolase family 3 C-terminal domain-containing protein [Salinivirgaceae bacterium]